MENNEKYRNAIDSQSWFERPTIKVEVANFQLLKKYADAEDISEKQRKILLGKDPDRYRFPPTK